MEVHNFLKILLFVNNLLSLELLPGLTYLDHK